VSILREEIRKGKLAGPGDSAYAIEKNKRHIQTVAKSFHLKNSVYLRFFLPSDLMINLIGATQLQCFVN
jgi:hypothetical protein